MFVVLYCEHVDCSLRRRVLIVGLVVLLGAFSGTAMAQDGGVLRWAVDPGGGAPFVQSDPANPSRLVGFDVEVADLIAGGLGRTPQFVLIAFASLDQSIA